MSRRSQVKRNRNAKARAKEYKKAKMRAKFKERQEAPVNTTPCVVHSPKHTKAENKPAEFDKSIWGICDVKNQA